MYKHFFKRVFDFGISLVALAVLSPLLLAVTLWLHFVFPVYARGRVLAFFNGTAGQKLRYAVGKTRRWWRNRWKYRLVYDENLAESLLWLARNRLKSF